MTQRKQMSMTHYERFLQHQNRAERAIGRHIVAVLEAGQPINGLVCIDTGTVNGTDKMPAALIDIARVSHARTVAALKALRS